MYGVPCGRANLWVPCVNSLFGFSLLGSSPWGDTFALSLRGFTLPPTDGSHAGCPS